MSGTPAPALVQAIELARMPTLAPAMRRAPLPAGILQVIRLAGGDVEGGAAAGAALGCSPNYLRDAAVLFVQEVMLHDGSDHYRVLGVPADADHAQLREHFRCLMRWLHPDANGDGWESVFAMRVSGAWDALKTPKRRADYDRELAAQPPGNSGEGKHSTGEAEPPTPPVRLRWVPLRLRWFFASRPHRRHRSWIRASGR